MVSDFAFAFVFVFVFGLCLVCVVFPRNIHLTALSSSPNATTNTYIAVCGGNILDDDHINQFRSTLLIHDPRERQRLRGKKIAAAFFFHGHVVALHVLRPSGGAGPTRDKSNAGEFDPANVVVELIDSLPHPSTWVIPDSGASSDDGEEREPVPEVGSRRGIVDCDDFDDDGEEEWERPERFDDDALLERNAIRVRCTDVEHLDTLIRHYGCSKFSGEELEFIRDNEWEDKNSYFDPRVFQAFVWAEA